MAGENGPSTQDSVGNVTNADGLMELFDQFSGLLSSVLDWLEPDAIIVISEASLQGKSATYQITIQSIITTTLLDTGANISVVVERFLRLLLPIPQLLKVCMHKVISASVANLGLVGQCDLTFRLGKKQFMDTSLLC